MNQSGKTNGASLGILVILTSVIDTDGVRGLWNGLIPSVVRKISWCTVFFVIYEQAVAL
jgi:hypothetical protein